MAFLLIENYIASTQSDRSWAKAKGALLVLRGVITVGDKIRFLGGWDD
jgi:hypothetical protein